MAKKSQIAFTKEELDYMFKVLDGQNPRGLEEKQQVVELMVKFDDAYKKFDTDAVEVP